jgi:uncharacterized protein YggE
MNKSIILNIVILAIAVVILIFSILSMTKPGAPTAAGVAGGQTPDVITVYGQGKISIKPDVAYITLGVRTTNIDAKAAQDNNASQMDAVMNALKSAGVKDADIQTASYNVYQQYDYSDGTEKSIGYEVTNLVRVTVVDVERAGEIISVTAKAGANRFDGIWFDVIDRDEAYIEAMDMALARALQKAEQLAKSTGRKIDGVVSVQESGTVTPYYQAVNYVSDAVSYESGSASPISSGQLEISATVNVVYRLK